MIAEPNRRNPDRKAQIVEIARRRFRASGLAGTTLETVATDAGVARPNLYRYFRSKSDLLAAVMAAEVDAVNARRAAGLAGVDGFADRVVRSFEFTVEMMSTDKLGREIVSPTNVPHTAYVAANDVAVLESNMNYWKPLLDSAEASGELRPGLDRSEVLRWLLGLEFMFIERREMFPTIEEVGHYTRMFVLPSIMQTER